MSVRFMSVLIGAFALTSAVTQAQRGQGANATEDPYLAFLRAGGGPTMMRGGPPVPADPGEIIRTMPETFPKELLPADAAFMIAAVASTATTVVASVKSTTPFDQIRYEWKVEDSGWVRNRPSRGGFVPESGAMSLPTTFCRGQDYANVTYRVAAPGEQLIRIALGKDPQRSCAPMGVSSFADVPMPLLAVPSQVRMMGSGSGGGLDETSSRTRLDTAMTLDAIVQHFVPQVRNAGWKVEHASADDVMSVTRFSGASKNGDPLTGMLIVTRLSDTPFVDAMFRVIRNKPVR